MTCKIMGILNVTPDSFSDGGCYASADLAVSQARKLLTEGADIIDVGAESSRPGALKISATEEMARLKPVLEILQANDIRNISVDTYKPQTAELALKYGASIINDICGIRPSREMAALVASSGVKWVLMDDEPVVSIENSLEKMAKALEIAQNYGVKKEQLIIDPGLGFNKNTADNLALTKALPRFKNFGYPLLYGPSRKRFLGEICGRLSALDRDLATAAICSHAVFLGADIVRVHNVAAVIDAIKIGESLKQAD